MTPKEKAEQLVQKYYLEVLYGSSKDYSERMLRIFTIKAKNCALITVDELLDAIDWDYYEGSSHPELNYWKEVKQEIEKL
jgi:hypothetical protein